MDVKNFYVKKFIAGGKEATLYLAAEENSPLVILNNYADDGSDLIKALGGLKCPAFNLLNIGNLQWHHDMTPWYCPPLSRLDAPCTGGADAYLQLLLSDILPRAKELLRGSPAHVSIAGYSLAGLFALYAMYHCDAFDRVSSVSGSLWFPDFLEYAQSHNLQRKPAKLYLSLGDKEAKTNNQYLKTVQANTEALAEHFRQLGIAVTWELNPGNHFRNAASRSAKGIMAIL